MKKIITLLVFLVFCSGFSQKHEHKKDSIYTTYIAIKEYKKRFTESLTKEDSLNFKIKDGDTLVKIDQLSRKGVYVPYEYKDSTFLKYYQKIAFRHKDDIYDEETTMKYWKKPIKIFFSKDISKKVRKEFMKFTREISSGIDSLNISRVKKLEDSNYVIYYKGGYEYEPRMVNYKNTDYYMYWNGKNQIYKTTIRLNTKNLFNEKLKLIELKRLFIKSLGNFNFIDEFECENYFANCYSKDKKFTNLDFEILKYHFSYGICKGTDLATFKEQHTMAKEILKKHNHKLNFVHNE